MSRFQRVRALIVSIAAIAGAICLIIVPAIGAKLITLMLSLTLGFRGVNTLLYYFTMARYMVDGQLVFFKGCFFLLLGLSMFSLDHVPLQYIMIYLLTIHGFAGLVDLLRSLESRRMHVRGWIIGALQGLFNLSCSVLCLVFINSSTTMVYIYSLTIICTALSTLAGVARKTAMVYIQ